MAWSEMVEAHRRNVRRAILDATGALVTEHGLGAVTMARIAERARIDRATLCRHFADLDAVMRAWHDRQIANHLAYVDGVGHEHGDPVQRLDAVLRAYAAIIHQTHEHHATELAHTLHGDERLRHARRHLHRTIRDLLAEGARAGDFRDDVAPDKLADYCLHMLSAVGGERSAAAIRRTVAATLTELRRP